MRLGLVNDNTQGMSAEADKEKSDLLTKHLSERDDDDVSIWQILFGLPILFVLVVLFCTFVFAIFYIFPIEKAFKSLESLFNLGEKAANAYGRGVVYVLDEIIRIGAMTPKLFTAIPSMVHIVQDLVILCLATPFSFLGPRTSEPHPFVAAFSAINLTTTRQCFNGYSASAAVLTMDLRTINRCNVWTPGSVNDLVSDANLLPATISSIQMSLERLEEQKISLANHEAEFDRCNRAYAQERWSSSRVTCEHDKSALSGGLKSIASEIDNVIGHIASIDTRIIRTRSNFEALDPDPFANHPAKAKNCSVMDVLEPYTRIRDTIGTLKDGLDALYHNAMMNQLDIKAATYALDRMSNPRGFRKEKYIISFRAMLCGCGYLDRGR